MIKTQSQDTNIKTEKVLIALIRQRSPAEKINQVRSLSKTIIQLSRRAISRTNRNLNVQGINLLFVSHHYGKVLATRLKKYFRLTTHENT